MRETTGETGRMLNQVYDCLDSRYLLQLFAEKSHIHISKNQTEVQSAASNIRFFFIYTIFFISNSTLYEVSNVRIHGIAPFLGILTEQ